MESETVAKNSTGDRLAELVDKLVAVQLDLRPICHDGKDDLPPEARSRVTDACQRLHVVVADLIEMLKPTHPALGAPERARGTSEARAAGGGAGRR